jgi:hypothetical protein
MVRQGRRRQGDICKEVNRQLVTFVARFGRAMKIPRLLAAEW